MPLPYAMRLLMMAEVGALPLCLLRWSKGQWLRWQALLMYGLAWNMWESHTGGLMGRLCSILTGVLESHTVQL